jgi:hypothetical protein
VREDAVVAMPRKSTYTRTRGSYAAKVYFSFVSPGSELSDLPEKVTVLESRVW